MTNIMLDLETFGTKPGSVIVSIGAATFDGLDTFHAFLDLEEQVSHGMSIDPNTVMWWLGQSDAARDAIRLKKPTMGVASVLGEFSVWYHREEGSAIWGNGSDFDLPMLAALYAKFGMTVPWKYNAGRDVRTIFALAGKKLGDFGTPNAIKHDALSDAIFQGKETALCWEYLNQRREIAQEAAA